MDCRGDRLLPVHLPPQRIPWYLPHRTPGQALNGRPLSLQENADVVFAVAQ